MIRQKYSADFEAFYKKYPHRVDKKKAFGIWKRLKPDDELKGIIYAAIENQKKARGWIAGFIPSPFRWLRDHRWEDEIEEHNTEHKPPDVEAQIKRKEAREKEKKALYCDKNYTDNMGKKYFKGKTYRVNDWDYYKLKTSKHFSPGRAEDVD